MLIALLLQFDFGGHFETNTKRAKPAHRAVAKVDSKATVIRREVNIYIGGDVAPAKKIALVINTKNVRQVPLQIYKLNPEDLRKIYDLPAPKPKPIGSPFRSVLVDVSNNRAALPAPQDTYYQRQFNLADIPPGYYLLQVQGGFKGQTWGTMNVTNLSVVIKRGTDKSLTWVTDAKTGMAVEGAEVTAYREGKATVAGRTNRQGIAQFAMPRGKDVFLIRRGKDMAALQAVGSSRDGTVVDHIQFDRPVYRPGQTVSYKSILRRIKGFEYEPIGDTPVTVEMLDAQSIVLERHELKTNSIGSVAGNFQIPREGSLGFYTVRIRSGNQTWSLKNFQVAEYRKPEFKVASSFSDKRYLAGDTIHLKVNAEYYFGAKLPNATVQLTVRRSGMNWQSADYEFNDGNLYSRNAFQFGEVVLNDVRKTGADGTLNIDLPTTATTFDANYEFSMVVTDGSNRQISHSNTVPVFASAVHVSANMTVGYVPLGRLAPLEVRLSDLDGKPVAGSVDLELRQSVWDEKQKRQVEQTVEQTSVKVPATGVLKTTMPAKVANYLTLVATTKDSGGRKTQSRSGIYVADPFTAPDSEKKPPNVSIRVDKRRYTVGETVAGYVESNRKGHPILLTMEGADLLSYQVLDKPGSFSYKLNPATSPQMEFSVSQWSEGSRVTGSNLVEVVDPKRRLTVELTPDHKEYSPGDPAKYTVTTKDFAGRPIGAEVALQVVDESIYAIREDDTPSLVATYWGYRPNGVQTIASAPREMAGGAFQMQKNMGKDAPMRTQFVDTAYWNPFVVTGRTGSATVEFEMPGNLTAWRAKARAVTGSTQVGEADASTRSSRPLTLRLAAPRQMVVGDRLDLIGTVTNRTANSQQVTVKTVIEGKTQEQTITAPAKGDARVTIPLEATKLGSLKVRGELLGADKVRLDGLEVGVPVNPNGIPFRNVTTGRASGQELSYRLPDGAIPGSAAVKVRFFASPANLVPDIESELLNRGRYTPIIAAEQVETAIRLGIPWTDDRIREPIAMLARTHQGAGWAWWDEGTPDPVITARVLHGLARIDKYPDWANLKNVAMEAARHQYRSIQFAEYRAHIVEALAVAGDDKIGGWVGEVQDSNTPISPTAQLALAHSLLIVGRKDQAMERINRLKALVSRGTSSYLPVGQGVGWTGSQLEANARLLDLLLEVSPNDALVDEMADWLIAHCVVYMAPGDTSAVLSALRHYSQVRPAPTRLGNLTVKIGGTEIASHRQPDGLWVDAAIPEDKIGQPISVSGFDASMPIRYTVEASVYKAATDEVRSGIRTAVRWEVMNEAGSWEELNRPVRPNEPVRVSTVVWGDSVTDAVKTVCPIPAGFEFVDQDRLTWARSEVRDGAVIYYTILRDSLPATFRYYIRAESGGSISAPAAMSEAIRRAEVRGNSAAMKINVRGN